MMKLKCIDNTDYTSYLTLNKIYTRLSSRTIINNDDILISITDDLDFSHYVPKKYFISIAEERNNKLTKLGI